MKKILLAFLTSALILTAAGCGEEKKEDTNKGGKVTQVAYEAPKVEDTTKEAVEYLKGQIPLFAKYLEKRMAIPLTFETETTAPDIHETSGVYIRDEASIAIRSTDDFGDSITMIYMDNMLYVVVDEEKTVYSVEYANEGIKKVVDDNRLKINLLDAQSFTYETGVNDYNGTTYNTEFIFASSEIPAEYYFDQSTDELKYVITGDTEIKVLNFSNTVTDDVFVIPEDYKKGDLNEYIEKLRGESEEGETAETEAAE